ncbi:hypothetical protein E8D34_04780 [Nocardioides sp. GY 10113]|uniref:hypothetical protein n=1 Tax=Nocardioides sp. GY 10113 TaxID=2569761 RepID=UPI0010A7EEC7|nr:hypothetical protein [Nocardioides sp. GY 10113]TIC88258.1 hypothetical protein E8D34_04780 [Nocardioides sp. GY 10113]
MTGGRHRAPTVRRRGRRRRLLGVALTALVALGAGPAHAFWTATSTAPDAWARAATLAAPVLTQGASTPTSVALSWSTSFTPTSVELSQSDGTLAGCSASPSPTATGGCTATGLVPNTRYTWTLTARRHGWVTQQSLTVTTDKQAATVAVGGLPATTGPAGASFSATATVTGFGTPAGTVLFRLFKDPSCTTLAQAAGAVPLRSGTATGSVQPAHAGTYYWQAEYTPTDGHHLPATSPCGPSITVTEAPSTLRLHGYDFWGGGYQGSRPTTLVVQQSGLQNAGPQTVTAFTLTFTFPAARVPATAPTSVTGAGWTYAGSSVVGPDRVLTFTWSRPLALNEEAGPLGFVLALTDNGPGTVTSKMTASGPEITTASLSASRILPS